MAARWRRAHALDGDPVDNAAPVVSAGTVGTASGLVGNPAATGAPVVSVGSLGGTVALDGDPVAVPAPTVSTGFESSSSATFPLRFLAGFEAWIDTSEAGFLGPPEYFCRIDGERVFDLADMGDFDHALFALDGLVHIAEPTPDGFLARVMVFFLGFVSGHSAPFAAFESNTTMATSFGMLDVEKGNVSLPWNVVWMGVEG